MAVHDKFAVLAQRLIAKNGRDVTLYQLSRTPADANKPWEGAGTGFADSLTGKAVIVEYQEDEIDDDQVKRGDKKLLIAAPTAAGKDLTKFNKLDDAGAIYSIVNVKLLKPGTTSILYTIQIRG